MKFLTRYLFAIVPLCAVIVALQCLSLSAETEPGEGGLYVNPEWFGEVEEEEDAPTDIAGGSSPLPDAGTADSDDDSLYVNPAWFADQGEQEQGETDENSTSPSTSPGSTESRSSRSQPDANIEISPELLAFVWNMIDRNEDNRASDKEENRAVRPARVFANHFPGENEEDEYATIRSEVRTLFDFDGSGELEKGEARYLLALVRGELCPTAKRAESYWQSLDTNNSQQLEPAEFVAKIEPLGLVGQAMAVPISQLLKSIDIDGDDQISREETYFSANAMLRIQLALEGAGGRDPANWVRFVGVIAALDLDADNVVSPWEANEGGMNAGMFAQIDSNTNQQLTPGEMCDMQDRIDAQLQAALDAYRAATSGSSGFG